MNNKNESGRSMVEMLGVLAIIGVLSVTAIYGYRQTMSRYKANQIWNDIMLWTTVIRGIPNYQSGSEKIKGQVKLNIKTTYPMKAYISDAETRVVNGAFYFHIWDIPEMVCQKMVQMRPDEMVSIKQNTTNADSCVSGNNLFGFYFDATQDCSNSCNRLYQEWKEYCGTTWEWCDPSPGAWCEKVVENDNCYYCQMRIWDKRKPIWSSSLWEKICR